MMTESMVVVNPSVNVVSTRGGAGNSEGEM